MNRLETETHTRIAGVTFGNRQALVRNLVEGETLELVREPENVYDSNAVAVRRGKDHLGYIGRELARDLAQEMDGGGLFAVFVSSITGGGYGKAHGVNIRIKKLREPGSGGSRFRGRG